MKLHTLAAAAVLSFSFAGAALAEGTVSATLAAPVAAKTRIIAEGAIFNCEGSTCVAFEAPSRAVSTLACKAVVKKVGAVSSFGAGNKALDAEDLAKCNGVATTQTASR